jgi:hypothetical protein
MENRLPEIFIRAGLGIGEHQSGESHRYYPKHRTRVEGLDMLAENDALEIERLEKQLAD